MLCTPLVMVILRTLVLPFLFYLLIKNDVMYSFGDGNPTNLISSFPFLSFDKKRCYVLLWRWESYEPYFFLSYSILIKNDVIYSFGDGNPTNLISSFLILSFDKNRCYVLLWWWESYGSHSNSVNKWESNKFTIRLFLFQVYVI